MTDIIEIVKGQMSFIVGYFWIVIAQYVLPPLFTTLQSFYNSTELEGIMWLGIILLYLTLAFAIPLSKIYKGLTTHTDNNPVIEITLALFIFIFNVLLTVRGWYFITGMSNFAQSDFISGIFWVGFTLSWVLCTLITPIYMIINSTGRHYG